MALSIFHYYGLSVFIARDCSQVTELSAQQVPYLIALFTFYFLMLLCCYRVVHYIPCNEELFSEREIERERERKRERERERETTCIIIVV